MEKIQYLRAMLTDNDKRSIVHANYMEGFAEGRDDRFKAGWKEGNAAGVTAGITEGKEKGRKDHILSLLKAGADMKLIVTATGLSPEEIRKLQ